MPLSPKDEIARYLSTGEHDGLYAAWPGESLIEVDPGNWTGG